MTTAGSTVVLSGTTTRLLAGERIYRQGYYDGGWHTWASTIIGDRGRFRFVIHPTVATTNVYRLVVKASPLHLWGKSTTLRLKVTP